MRPIRALSFAPLLALFLLAFASSPRPAVGAEGEERVSVAATLERGAEGGLTARVRLRIAPGLHLYAPGETNGLPVRVSAKAPATGGEARYPAPVLKRYESLGGELKLYEGEIGIDLPLTPAPGATTVEVELFYQACDDARCFMPETRLLPLPVPGKEAAPGSPAQDVPTQTAPAAKDEGTFARAYRESGILYVIALAFALGLLSSLTPCVYPMIPITVAFFGGQSGQGRTVGRKFLLSLVFALGIGLSFSLLGGIFTWLGRDLGTIFASVYAAGAIAAVLFLFAMASFEWVEIRLPASLMNRLGGGGDGEAGVASALVMGLTMGLVAAPCVGPFAGSLLLFVATLGSVALGFLLLFVYGLGLGALFMAVALGATFLPRAGGWMVSLKNAFGIVILLTTVYVLQFALAPFLLLLYTAFALLLCAIVSGLFEPAPPALTGRFALSRAFALLFLVAGLLFAARGALLFIDLVGWAEPAAESARPPLPSGAQAPGRASGERFADHDAALAAGAKEGRPVLLDFYADWCLPCKQMDALFKDPEVAAELSRFVVAKLDCTSPDLPGARVKRERYAAPYMPYIVLYDAKGAHRADLDIHGYVDKAALLSTLRAVR